MTLLLVQGTGGSVVREEGGLGRTLGPVGSGPGGTLYTLVEDTHFFLLCLGRFVLLIIGGVIGSQPLRSPFSGQTFIMNMVHRPPVTPGPEESLTYTGSRRHNYVGGPKSGYSLLRCLGSKHDVFHRRVL